MKNVQTTARATVPTATLDAHASRETSSSVVRFRGRPARLQRSKLEGQSELAHQPKEKELHKLQWEEFDQTARELCDVLPWAIVFIHDLMRHMKLMGSIGSGFWFDVLKASRAEAVALKRLRGEPRRIRTRRQSKSSA
jgi:hypothetical protein